MRNLVLSLPSSKQAALKALALTMMLSLLVFTLALAASGDLDPTFSGNGKLTTNFGGGLNDNARAGLWRSNRMARSLWWETDSIMVSRAQYMISL